MNDELPPAEKKLIEAIKKGIDSEKNFEALKKLNDKQESEITAEPLIKAIELESAKKIEKEEKAHETKVKKIISEYEDLVDGHHENHKANLNKLEQNHEVEIKEIEEDLEKEKNKKEEEILEEHHQTLNDINHETFDDVLNRQIEYSEKLAEHMENTEEKLNELKEDRDNQIEHIIEEYERKKEMIANHNEIEEKIAVQLISGDKVESQESLNEEIVDSKLCLDKIKELEVKIDKLEDSIEKTYNLRPEN